MCREHIHHMPAWRNSSSCQLYLCSFWPRVISQAVCCRAKHCAWTLLAAFLFAASRECLFSDDFASVRCQIVLFVRWTVSMGSIAKLAYVEKCRSLWLICTERRQVVMRRLPHFASVRLNTANLRRSFSESWLIFVSGCVCQWPEATLIRCRFAASRCRAQFLSCTQKTRVILRRNAQSTLCCCHASQCVSFCLLRSCIWYITLQWYAKISHTLACSW